LAGPFETRRSAGPIDLGTVRDILSVIREDLQRLPGLQLAAELLGCALDEIAMAEQRQTASIPRSVLDARFRPRRRH